MSRRIDVELTSARDDSSWTWRAAGARQPKGTLDGSLLPAGSKVGDVLRVEVETTLDGINVLQVLPSRTATPEAPRLELIGSGRDEPLVTTVLAPKGRGGGDRKGRGPRRDRPERGARGDRPEREARGERPGGARRERAVGEARPRGERPSRPPRPARPAPEPRPKAKRLRAGRNHRNALVASLPPEQRPVAEQVLRGGLPGVRQGIEKQNEQARAEGRPEIPGEALLALAEQLLPSLRLAEWRDRAEAALADIDELDLRDLRTVVVAADANARDEETRELAATLRTKLAERVEQAQTEWLTDLRQAVAEGRVVRALKISSRPPKAGALVPPDLLAGLTEVATASLTPEAGQDRWRMVVEALAFSPVHASVVPDAVPAEPGEELLTVVRKSAGRLPELAARFGIEAGAGRKPRRPPRPPRPAGSGPAAPPAARPPAPAAPPVAEVPAAESAEADVAPTAPSTAPGASADLATADSEPQVAPADPTPAEAPAPDSPTADASGPAGEAAPEAAEGPSGPTDEG